MELNPSYPLSEGRQYCNFLIIPPTSLIYRHSMNECWIWQFCLSSVTSLLEGHTQAYRMAGDLCLHTQQNPSFQNLHTNCTNMQIIHEYNVNVLIDKAALLLRQLLRVLINFQFVSVSYCPKVKVIINTSLKLNYCTCTEPNTKTASCYQKETIPHIHIRYQVWKKYWCIFGLYQNDADAWT